jgi:hypothetical protein
MQLSSPTSLGVAPRAWQRPRVSKGGSAPPPTTLAGTGRSLVAGIEILQLAGILRAIGRRAYRLRHSRNAQ